MKTFDHGVFSNNQRRLRLVCADNADPDTLVLALNMHLVINESLGLI